MSETKEPYKTYWTYQGYPCDFQQIGVSAWSGCKLYKNMIPPEISMVLHTYLFDTQEEAIYYAEECGEFEDTHGKEDWCERCDESIFEVNESELEDYAPVIFKLKEKAA